MGVNDSREQLEVGQRLIAEVEAERDSFKRQAEHFADRGNQAEAELDQVRRLHEALAAVIESVNDWFDDTGDRVLPNGDALARILHAADTDATLREVRARELIAFADAVRMPWKVFEREDGSAVTVGDLLREKAAAIREGRA